MTKDDLKEDVIALIDTADTKQELIEGLRELADDYERNGK